MPGAIFDVMAPVFAVIALGYATVVTGFLCGNDIRALGRFVIGVALPALIFGAVAGSPLDATINPGFLAAYGLASVAVFGFGVWRSRREGGQARAMQGLGMALSNSGFMGYPIAVIVIGDGAARVLAQTMIIENLVILPLALALAEFDRRSGRGLHATLLGVAGELLRNPILIGIAAGLVAAAIGLPLPAAAEATIGLLAGASAPVALFVVGGTIASVRVRAAAGPVVWVVAGKLVIHPLAVIAALMLVPDPDPVLVAGGILFASVPMLSIYAILGQRYGVEALCATAMVTATAASVVTLGIVLFFLERGGLIGLAR